MPVPTDLKTPESASIEQALGRAFEDVSSYRYNSASIRVRVIDERFRGKSPSEREALVAPLLEALPESIQDDITILLLLAPGELDRSLANLEFEEPSPSSF